MHHKPSVTWVSEGHPLASLPGSLGGVQISRQKQQDTNTNRTQHTTHPIQQSNSPTAATMGRKCRTAFSVVPKNMEAMFNHRCKEQLRKMGVTETAQPLPILGTSQLNTGNSVGTCMSKLRAFAKFMLDFPEFDDSLILLCPKTPKGIVTCSEKAASCFILSACGKKNTPLLDITVSFQSISNVSSVSNVFFETPSPLLI